MTVNTIALPPSCQITAHGTCFLSLSSGAVTNEILKKQRAQSQSLNSNICKTTTGSEEEKKTTVLLEPKTRPSPAEFLSYEPEVSCGCLLIRRNVYLWITCWKPILLCGRPSQSHQTSIKVLVKCLLDFFIIHLEALRLAPDQKWHGSLLKDLYTYATAIPEWCQESENVFKWYHTLRSHQGRMETQSLDKVCLKFVKLSYSQKWGTKCWQPWKTPAEVIKSETVKGHLFTRLRAEGVWSNVHCTEI